MRSAAPVTGLTPDAWARFQRFLPGNLRPLVRNPQVQPHWVAPGRCWYWRETPDGRVRVVVDARDGSSTEDHGMQEPAEQPSLRAGETLSPDGRLAAFRRGNDLWVRDTSDGTERRLTGDGAPHFAWAKSADMNLTTVTLARKGIVLPAAVAWAPDSRRLFTYRLDERRVAEMPLVQHVPEDGSARPRLHQLRVALSGDQEVPLAHHAVIDARSGTVVPARAAPSVSGVTSTVERQEAWWSEDSARVFFLDRDRFSRRVTLREMDAASGAVRDVLTEEADTFVDVNLSVTGLPNIRVLDRSGEVVWFSQRDGWAHLYLHDLRTGAMRNRITGGEWVVRDLVAVDEGGRQAYFLAAGLDPSANPYHRVFCRAPLDGGAMEVLTSAPGDHGIATPQLRVPRDYVRPAEETGQGLSPDFRFFVHTRTSLDSLPVSSLRRTADGSLVRVLETASLDPALAAEWRWPRSLRFTAADGSTALYGALWLPTWFDDATDPGRRLPVVDLIYPGPQRGQTPTAALPGTRAELFHAALPQAVAELGFAVFNVDGRGTPLRSKAFHDWSYGRLDDPGCLEDHVAALRQLLAAHPFLDGERVGMMGHSGGGYATVRAMLEHPDIYRAGIATAGNHDQKGYSFAWCEKYQGPLVPTPDGGTSYDRAANPPLAQRLQGKLFLATGDMDDNVPPALTLQLVAALVAADRDFEMLVVPNEDHGSLWSHPYFLRRAMDFLVRALAA